MSQTYNVPKLKYINTLDRFVKYMMIVKIETTTLTGFTISWTVFSKEVLDLLNTRTGDGVLNVYDRLLSFLDFLL